MRRQVQIALQHFSMFPYTVLLGNGRDSPWDAVRLPASRHHHEKQPLQWGRGDLSTHRRDDF